MSSEQQSDTVRLQVVVPRVWLERLHELARERAISLSDVVRIFLRDALYPARRGD